MGAWDVATRTIHSNSWDAEESVTIKEPTYGQTMSITKSCTGADGEFDDVKLSNAMLLVGIVSWTLKKGDKVPKVTIENINSLPTSYVTFIAEEIGKFAVNTDDDFPIEPGTGTQGQGEHTSGDDAS